MGVIGPDTVAPSIFKQGLVEYTKFGVADGVIYIEGIRGTITTTSVGYVGNLTYAGTPYSTDFVPSLGTQSANRAIGVLVDRYLSANIAANNVTSGNIYQIAYAGMSQTSSGGYGMVRDQWTAT